MPSSNYGVGQSRLTIDDVVKRGFDLDLTELIYFDQRNDVADYLAGSGW
ncbi:hypothetical protein [Mycobacterium canetti]|nr:hypothetical protein [Mycobacterium canetti]